MNEKTLKDLLREITQIRKALERIARGIEKTAAPVNVETTVDPAEPGSSVRDRAVEAVSDALIKRFCNGLINDN